MLKDLSEVLAENSLKKRKAQIKKLVCRHESFYVWKQ